MPVGSSAALSDTTAVKPTFTVDKAGIYVVSLVVNDGTLNSEADTVTISTSNSAPVANAGADQTPLVNGTVTLDGKREHRCGRQYVNFQLGVYLKAGRQQRGIE